MPTTTWPRQNESRSMLNGAAPSSMLMRPCNKTLGCGTACTPTGGTTGALDIAKEHQLAMPCTPVKSQAKSQHRTADSLPEPELLLHKRPVNSSTEGIMRRDGMLSCTDAPILSRYGLEAICAT